MSRTTEGCSSLDLNGVPRQHPIITPPVLVQVLWEEVQIRDVFIAIQFQMSAGIGTQESRKVDPFP